MDLGSAYTSVNFAKDFAAYLIGRKIDSAVTDKAIEMQSHIIELQSTILSAQSEYQSLHNQISELKNKITTKENWEKKSSNYQLYEASRGCFVYKIKPDVNSTDPEHWLCANCFIKDRASIMQRNGGGMGFIKYSCHECNASITTPSQK